LFAAAVRWCAARHSGSSMMRRSGRDRHQLLARRLLPAVRRPAVAGPAVHEPPTVQLASEDRLDPGRAPLVGALRGVATVLAGRVLHALAVERRGDLKVAHPRRRQLEDPGHQLRLLGVDHALALLHGAGVLVAEHAPVRDAVLALDARFVELLFARIHGRLLGVVAAAEAVDAAQEAVLGGADVQALRREVLPHLDAVAGQDHDRVHLDVVPGEPVGVADDDHVELSLGRIGYHATALDQTVRRLTADVVGVHGDDLQALRLRERAGVLLLPDDTQLLVA
jgi:hypothetical protein